MKKRNIGKEIIEGLEQALAYAKGEIGLKTTTVNVPSDSDQNEETLVSILYTNWKGETSTRRIEPLFIHYGSNEWHPESQWLLRAFDVDKKAERDFAVKDIAKWE